ncbi:hypothetical protein K438DRAFT_1974419 [Mycena galopus ATCC 62051]|nr:hypothetical protein K438DRAFT_1974419 [Mycena galopus ATCC 62051]
MRRVRVRGIPFTSLNSLPSLLLPSRTIASTSASANTSAGSPLPARPALCVLLLDTIVRAHGKAWAMLDQLEGVDNGVNAAYYQVAGDYYKAKAEYAPYYRHSLLFLACVANLDTDMSTGERLDRARHGLFRSAERPRTSSLRGYWSSCRPAACVGWIVIFSFFFSSDFIDEKQDKQVLFGELTLWTTIIVMSFICLSALHGFLVCDWTAYSLHNKDIVCEMWVAGNLAHHKRRRGKHVAQEPSETAPMFSTDHTRSQQALASRLKIDAGHSSQKELGCGMRVRYKRYNCAEPRSKYTERSIQVGTETQV